MIVIPIRSKVYGDIQFFIDGEDFEKIKNYKWFAHFDKTINNYYVRSKKQNKYIPIHRYIMDCPKGMVVDHIDGNPLNNCRSNLRICTPQQNAMNKKPYKNKISTKYKGVYTVTGCKNKWQAQINHNKKYLYLGTFDSQEKAAEAYNAAALKYYGEFAHLNEVIYA